MAGLRTHFGQGKPFEDGVWPSHATLKPMACALVVSWAAANIGRNGGSSTVSPFHTVNQFALMVSQDLCYTAGLEDQRWMPCQDASETNHLTSTLHMKIT